MACGSAARILPWRRIPRSRSRTARLATPAVTAGSVPGSAPVGGAATYETVRRNRPAVAAGAEVKEFNIWQVMTMGFISGAQIPLRPAVEEADGAAWGAGDRQPRRLINDNCMGCRFG